MVVTTTPRSRLYNFNFIGSLNSFMQPTLNTEKNTLRGINEFTVCFWSVSNIMISQERNPFFGTIHLNSLPAHIKFQQILTRVIL